jgi:hypothetical protein
VAVARNQAAIKKNEISAKQSLHPSGVEPEPIAWKAIILPLDHGSG